MPLNWQISTAKLCCQNFFPNCEGWVQRGTIWTDFDLKCVTQHEKNYEFCLNCVISCFSPTSPFVDELLALTGQVNILHLYFLPVTLDIPNLPPVFPLKKLENDCGVLFTDPVASFVAFSQNTTSQFLKNGCHFLLQSICFHFMWNAYYV